ncbi:MAG: HAMP domain-containing histidine kinase [Deltaproteobacteria bacterium]|nr:HAMP domain-containing histidine kinase [Deltaproteobacteria bacterium]
MAEITDKVLLETLEQKFKEKDKALANLQESYSKLEDAHKRLFESERTRSSFLSNLRNEINNPMTSLLALSEEMRTLDLGNKERYQAVAGMLLSETLNLDAQMRNLLCAAELESGEVSIELARVNVKSIVDDTLRSLSTVIEKRNIKVNCDCDKDLWVNTDPDKFSVIVANLISNGIIFNVDDGDLEIYSGYAKDEFFFSVRDHGIGISEDDQQKIFNRFSQLETGSTKRYSGLGLGLSVAKASSELLSGQISVESKPNTGSTFIFTAPANKDVEVENVCIDGAEFFTSEGEEIEL